jgi:bacillithiol system protein YtxJ
MIKAGDKPAFSVDAGASGLQIVNAVLMNWTEITSANQLDRLNDESKVQAVLIYKHSNRCHICTSVLDDIERQWLPSYDTSLKPYFLDVIRNRDLSQAVSEQYGIVHESPQALVIIKGKCVFHRSHFQINLDELLEKAAAI